MKRRWRMLSFRVGVLGTAALAALVARRLKPILRK